MRGGVGMGRIRSKKFKLIPVLSRSAELKSRLIPTSSPLWGGKNPCGAKRGGARRGKIVIPNYQDTKNNKQIK